MANNTRQQTINTFTGGLNTDLHPLTTPNDVLTDCVNGTVITYNGNEFILQNDMGNYKLKKAILPADYIPVGIKEYGNIIYIVSYNPIEKKCQIGSYPSPQTLFGDDGKMSKDDEYQGIQINALSDNWHWDTNSDDLSIIYNPDSQDDSVLFTKYKPQQNLKVFFPQSGELEDTYLNPGDKYWLYKENIVSDERDIWKFQKISYCVLNESKEVYELDSGEVEEKSTEIIDDNLMSYVTWEIPGWLGYKPSLLEPTSFNIYLTNINIPAFLAEKSQKSTELEGKLNFNIQGQITIDSNNYWNRYFDNLKVLFEYKINDGPWIYNKWGADSNSDGHIFNEENKNFLPDTDDATSTNYGNKINVLTYNEYGSVNIAKGDKTVIIRATPYIIDQTGEHGVVYDNLVVTYIINLEDLYNVNDIKVFDTYKYLVDTDEVTINLTIISPTSNLNQITCKYKIYSINNNLSGVSDISGYRDIDSLNMLGQNMFTIDFYNSENENSIKGFEKENIYILELAFFNVEDTECKNVLFKTAQFLITSEIINDFYSSTNKFQDISLSEWTTRIKNHTNVEKNISFKPENQVSTLYSKYIRAYSSDAIFDNTYYTQDSEQDSNFIAELDTAESNVVDTIINNKDMSLSAFYGCLKSNLTNLKYEIPTPSILGNQGIWEDATWDNQTFSTVTSINNGNNREKINPVTTHILKTKLEENLNNIDDSVTTIYAKALLGSYISNLYSGKEGTRWYLYKNLTWNFSQTGKWNTAKIASASSNYPKWTEQVTGKDGKKTTRIDTLYKQTLLGTGTPRYAYQAYAISSSKYHFGMIYNVRGSDKFDYNTLNYIGNRENFSTSIRDSDGSTEKFDKFITDNNSILTFTVVLPSSGKPYSTGRSYKRGWNFPDAGKRCYGSQSYNSAGVAILCKDGNTKSAAVIKYFQETYNDYFKGRIGTTGDGDLYTTWLVSTDHSVSGENIIPNLIPNGASSQKMNECVGALLFALGIHLYGYINLVQKDKSYISYSGSQISSSSDRTFTIRYTRTDTLKSIIYKGIDIKNQSLSSLDNLFTSIGVEKEYYSVSNLNGNFSNVEITTKTNAYSYIDNTSLDDFSVKFTTFTRILQNLLSTKISEWTNSINYSLDKVYSDFSSENRISTTLNTIADLLIFEYKEGTGRFYYKGLPDVLIHPISAGRIQGGCIRAINWSDIISWDNVYLILTPTQEFLESEGITYE